MSMIADKIEKFILDRMREEQEKLILKRNELADELDCAPSQISYVLSTRFSNERGFDVESRRGLGGYTISGSDTSRCYCRCICTISSG